MNHYRRFWLKIAVLAVAALAVSVGPLLAAPMFGKDWKLRQPDATWVDVKIWGDEYYQDVESPDGYTLIRDPDSGFICYAYLSTNGNEYLSTGVHIGASDPATSGLPKHLRINRQARDAQASQNRALAYASERDAIASGEITLMAPPDHGNVVGLCLLADFSDQVASKPQADVSDFCNLVGYSGNSNNGSVRDYFYDVSDGALTYTSYVSPNYYRASHPFSWYDDCDVAWLERAKQLIIDILNDMEANGFDFSQYDGNNDGYIDAVNLLYAGNTGCGWAKGMWPGSGSMGGFSADGVSINRFQITGMGTAPTLGTYCHENGHMICYYPDLYDYDYDSAGVGNYCLMASGGADTNPTEVCAPLKLKSGWATVTQLVGKATGLSLPAGVNTFYQFTRPSNLIFPGENFLIENRQKTGRDASLPDAGLAIWHVEEIYGDHNDQSRSTFGHFPYTLIQADGNWDLESNVNGGDSSDLYAAPTYTALTACTAPNTNWWDGSTSGLSITNVGIIGANMTFDFSPNNDPPVALTHSYSANAGMDCCIEVTVADINNGSYDPDGPGDIKSVCITAVDGDPVNCHQEVYVCGSGSHTVTLTVTDLCDNTSSADAAVEIIDVSPPHIAVALERDVLWPPNHKMVEICGIYETWDNCDPEPDVALVSISSDEPEDGLGDGNSTDDIQGAAYGTEDLCFMLRSERMGGGDGRVYTIVYSATDESGNVAYATVHVRVPHDQAGGAYASTGFVANGSALEAGAESFALIIPAVEGMDAASIEMKDIYVGNTAGAIRPIESRYVHLDADGRLDLALFFSSDLPVSDGNHKRGDVITGVSDGTIGLHYVSPTGVDFLVADIFALGEPVPMPMPAVLPPMPPPPKRIPDVVQGGQETMLSTIHPNPFNPQTTVEFTLASEQRVRIAIYDVRGSLVRRLVDQAMPAGGHQVVWNGIDEAGRPAPTGVYFVQMTANRYVQTCRVLMLK